MIQVLLNDFIMIELRVYHWQWQPKIMNASFSASNPIGRNLGKRPVMQTNWVHVLHGSMKFERGRVLSSVGNTRGPCSPFVWKESQVAVQPRGFLDKNKTMNRLGCFFPSFTWISACLTFFLGPSPCANVSNRENRAPQFEQALCNVYWTSLANIGANIEKTLKLGNLGLCADRNQAGGTGGALEETVAERRRDW